MWKWSSGGWGTLLSIAHRADQVVCGAHLWVSVANNPPVDATFPIVATLTEHGDATASLVTDVSGMFVRDSETETASARLLLLTLFGQGLVEVNGESVTFARVAGGEGCLRCDSLTLSQEALAAPVAFATSQFTDAWSNLGLVLDLVGNELGCIGLNELGATQPGGAQSVRQAQPRGGGMSCADCDKNYCPSFSYCGVGRRATNEVGLFEKIARLPEDSCLNEVCFAHDACYIEKCFRRSACAFSPRTFPCDARMLRRCADPACVTSIKEGVICSIPHAASKKISDWNLSPPVPAPLARPVNCFLTGETFCDDGCRLLYDGPSNIFPSRLVCRPCFAACGTPLTCPGVPIRSFCSTRPTPAISALSARRGSWAQTQGGSANASRFVLSTIDDARSARPVSHVVRDGSSSCRRRLTQTPPSAAPSTGPLHRPRA